MSTIPAYLNSSIRETQDEMHSNAVLAVRRMLPDEMKVRSRITAAKWAIKLLVIFLKAIAVRFAGILFANRNKLSVIFRRDTLKDLLTFAIGATSIPGLFIMTRYVMRLLQKLLNCEFETLELLVSGAVSSLGITIFFENSYLAAIKTVAYMRAV